jgi:hypothetical protein
MASKKIGNAAAAEACGVPEFDLLAGGVDRQNNSTSESTQAASSITVTVRGPGGPKGRPRFTRTRFVYGPTATRKYETHGRLAAQLVMGDRAPLGGPSQDPGPTTLPADPPQPPDRRPPATSIATRCCGIG